MADERLAELCQTVEERRQEIGRKSDSEVLELAVEGVKEAMRFVASLKIEGRYPNWHVGRLSERGSDLVVLEFGKKLGPTEKEEQILKVRLRFSAEDLPESIVVKDCLRVFMEIVGYKFRLATRLGIEENSAADYEVMPAARIAEMPEIVCPWLLTAVDKPFKIYRVASRGIDYALTLERVAASLVPDRI